MDGFDRGAQPRYRKDGLVVPVLAARHARLGRHTSARAYRRPDRRAAAQVVGAGQPKWLLLPAGSDQRQKHPYEAIHRIIELVQRDRREGPAITGSGEGPPSRGSVGFPEYGRGHELARAQLQSGHGSVLRGHVPSVLLVLPDRYRPASARLGRSRALPRKLGELLAGHRL